MIVYQCITSIRVGMVYSELEVNLRFFQFPSISLRMKNLPVTASFCSRLEADIAIVRLRRVGIACDQMSAAFPRRLFPNAVACWMATFAHTVFQFEDEPYHVAGPWGGILTDASDDRSLLHRLERVGFGRGTATLVLERFYRRNIVLCIHCIDAQEASLAERVLRGCAADLIAAPVESAGGTLSPAAVEARPVAA